MENLTPSTPCQERDFASMRIACWNLLPLRKELGRAQSPAARVPIRSLLRSMLTPVFQCPPRGARLRRAAILLCGFQLYRLRHAFVQFAKYRPDVAEYVSPHQPTPCPLHIGQSKTSMLTIVIGDIHGMAAKLQNLLTTSTEAQTRARYCRSSNAFRPPAPSAFEAITKSSCFAPRSLKGTSPTSYSTVATQPLPPCTRRRHFGERKNGCARSRPAMKILSVTMFTLAFVQEYPSTSRRTKRNSGSVKASFTTPTRFPNTSFADIRRRSTRTRAR